MCNHAKFATLDIPTIPNGIVRSFMANIKFTDAHRKLMSDALRDGRSIRDAVAYCHERGLEVSTGTLVQHRRTVLPLGAKVEATSADPPPADTLAVLKKTMARLDSLADAAYAAGESKSYATLARQIQLTATQMLKLEPPRDDPNKDAGVMGSAEESRKALIEALERVLVNG